MRQLPIVLTGDAVGVILKEMVRRAMHTIRHERSAFEATVKRGYDGEMDDVFTSADTKAQAIFEKGLKECFPGVGILGEEKLTVPCTIPGFDAYFTIDPLDGTKAFVRRQSHGTATMVAMVVRDEIVSAWIGDVNTLEIYGYRPGSDKVHRIHETGESQYLHEVVRETDLKKVHVLLRKFPRQDTNPLVSETARRFRDIQVEGSSIGIWFARLWKGEVAAGILEPSAETPWDATPCVGISQKLGFAFLRPVGYNWVMYDPSVPREVERRDHYTLVVHKDLLDQFM